MALRLLWSPPEFHKPSTTLSSLFHSIPHSFITEFSSISYTKTRTNLPIVKVSSATVQSSSITNTPDIPINESEEEEEPKTRLFAQNIPWTSTPEDIQKLFEKHGNVINVELSMYNKEKNRGLAYVTMSSEEEALEALTKLKSCEYEGRVINVEFAKPRKKKAFVERGKVAVPRYDVFVANLSWKVKARDLKEFFSSMNEDVVAAEVTYQMKPTRKPTGFGFVSFSSKEKAEEAISTFQGKELMGKPVRLALSTRSQKAESNDGKNVGDVSNEINGGEGSDNVDEINTSQKL